MIPSRFLRVPVAPLLVIVLLAGTACTSAQKRAQEALEKGDFTAAAQGFEYVLKREPDNLEARAGLTEARSRILEARLIDVRKTRQGGNPAGAAEQLLAIIALEGDWKQQPRAAAVFTQQEETEFARGFALTELKGRVEANKPLATEIVFRKYAPFFSEVKPAALKTLQTRNHQLGVSQCKSFAQENYAGLPYGAAFTQRFCAFYGEHPSLKGADPAAINRDLVRELKVEGAVAGLPAEVAHEIAPSLNRVLQASAWYSAAGTEAPVLTLAGEFKFDQNRLPIQLVHSYTENESYIENESQTKYRDVPYETLETALNPKTGAMETHAIIKHRSEPYQESVPVKKTRAVNKTYPYGAWKIQQSMQLDLRATGQLAGRTLQLAVADHKDAEDTLNEIENVSVGLKRKEAVLPDRYVWLKEKREILVANLRTELDQLWRDLYCKAEPAGSFAQAANAAGRCLRQNSAATPAPVEEWSRRTFGVTSAEVNALLAER